MSRTIVITGAGRGIGARLADQYLASGATVVATVRKQADADRLSAAGAETVQMDVTDRAGVAALKAHMGDRPIDVLINNAGVIGGDGPQCLGNLDMDDWAETMRINVFAPFAVTEALTANVLDSGERKIIIISSVMGSIAANASPEKIIYRSSKAAVNQVAKALHNTLAPKGAIVVPMHPGWVSTDMGGPSAPVTPEASASGLKQVIDALTPAQSGVLRDHLGAEIPW